MKIVSLALVSAGLVMAGSTAPSTAGDRCPSEEVRRIVEQGIESTSSGNCPDEGGNYIVAVMRLGGRTAEEARLRALASIGAVLGIKVGVREESGTAERTTGETVEFDSFFKSSTTTSIDQALAGVQGRGLVRGESEVFAVFVLSDRTIDSTVLISEAASRRADGPVTVTATGIAEIRDGRVDAAKRAATDAALRQSVEMVVGAAVVARTALDQVDDAVGIRNQMANTSLGLVDRYEVVQEGQEANFYTVTVQSTIVPKKLLDNFESIMRSMGDPLFFLDAGGDEVLEIKLQEFFRGKGLRLTMTRDQAVYIIKASAKYSEVEDPSDATGETKGMRGQLRLDIVEARTGEVLGGDLRTDGRATSFVGSDPERQKELVCMTVLERHGEQLHRKLQEFIERQMAGRRIRVVVTGVPSLREPDVRRRFLSSLEEVSFIEDVQVVRSAATRLEVDVLLLGRSEELSADVLRAIRNADPRSAVVVVDESAHQLVVGAR